MNDKLSRWIWHPVWLLRLLPCHLHTWFWNRTGWALVRVQDATTGKLIRYVWERRSTGQLISYVEEYRPGSSGRSW